MESKGVAVVRAFAFHHCGPESNPGGDAICGLSLLVVSLLREVFLRVLQFPLLKNQHFQIPIRSEVVDEEPLCGCAISKSLLIN